MSLSKLINNYTAYNSWANGLIIERLQQEDEHIFSRKIESSFASIDHTIQHILKAQQFWLAFIMQDENNRIHWAFNEGQASNNLMELKLQSEKMQIEISTFTEIQLENTLKFDSPWAKNELPRYEYIMHCVNHSTYHRGQIITAARSLGISDKIPSTDYNFFNNGKVEN